MVVFDATILLPLLSPNVPAPMDPATGKPVEYYKERIDFLIAELERTRTKVIMPTPALSEILVHADRAGPEYLNQIEQSSVFKIEPFDERAAIEVALMTRDAIKAGDKRGGVNATWAKVKFDRQIVAIAKVNNASAIYSDDEGVKAFAKLAGINAIGILELPLPPK
jgi:hypothetical protein